MTRGIGVGGSDWALRRKESASLRDRAPSIMSLPVVDVVAILLLLCAPTPVSGQTCYLDNMPVLTLAYQPHNQTFVRLNRTRSLLSSADNYKSEEQNRFLHEHQSQRQQQPHQRRHLRHLESLPLLEIRRFIADTATEEPSNKNGSGVLVRQCYCAPNQALGPYDGSNNNSAPSPIEFYCPVDLNLCVIPRYYSLPASQRGTLSPECYRTTNRLNVVLTMWPIILVWFILIFAVSLATATGRNSWDYVLSTCLPCWNNRIVVPIMIRRNPTRAQRLLQRDIARHHPPPENGWVVEAAASTSLEGPGRNREFPDELVLRTARYGVGGGSICGITAKKGGAAGGWDGGDPLTCREPAAAPPEDDDGSDDGDGGADTCGDAADTGAASSSPPCPICLGPLCAGDRIGQLPCHHAIHADCLKPWLVRRNVCPLCLTPQVALPRASGRSGRSRRRPSRPRSQRSAARGNANANGNAMVSDRRASY